MNTVDRLLTTLGPTLWWSLALMVYLFLLHYEELPLRRAEAKLAEGVVFTKFSSLLTFPPDYTIGSTELKENKLF